MSIRYEVKGFANSFSAHPELLARVRKTIESAYNQFSHITEWSETARGSEEERKTFYIYLIDADDDQTSEHLNKLLAEPLQKTFSLPVMQDSDGIFLFLSRSKSFTAWLDKANPHHSILKNSEFYIRMFVSYQLGKFVWYEGPEQALRDASSDEELATILKRLAYKHAGRKPHQRLRKQPPKVRNVQTLIEEMHKDVIALYRIAQEEKIEGYANFRENLDDGTESEADSPASFLKTLNILYQLGRRPYTEANRNTSELAWLKEFGGSFKLKQKINRELQDPQNSKAATLKDMLVKLRMYEMYRDLARWLASGARYWAETLESLNVLIIDEYLEPTGVDYSDVNLYLKRLKNIYDAFNMPALRVDRVSKAALKNLEAHLWQEHTQVFERLPGFGEGPAYTNLRSYHLILVEVEFSQEYIGPSIVQSLAAYFDNKGINSHRPSIIVLSLKDNFSQVQQCLNLGAEAYVMKERIYALPARIAQARIPRSPAEPRGRKSNFRSLYQLRPQDIVKLHDERLYGYSWDTLEKNWLKALPKADLHTHIGTCISLPTIEALALNTSGYLLSNVGGPKDSETKNNVILKNLEEIIERICQIIIWAGVLYKAPHPSIDSPAKLLWTATICVLEMEGIYSGLEVLSTQFPDKQIYDSMIRLITRGDRQIEPFEVCSLLVAAICLTGGAIPGRPLYSAAKYGKTGYLNQAKERVTRQWSYLQDLQVWADANTTQPSGDEDSLLQRCWINELLAATANHCQIITRVAWQRGLTKNWSEMNFPSVKPWEHCFSMVLQRAHASIERLDTYFEKALTKLHRGINRLKSSPRWNKQFDEASDIIISQIRSWPPLPNQFSMPSLADLVRIPEPQEAKDQNLLRYLWGAGLLGADHLQYPENLLLVGKDIVEQGANDNIAYAEIRCATNGYRAGGMSPSYATDLLCYSFDVAAAYTALKEKKRWVRTNILLGAKRQKSEEEFREIVSLLTNYLQRGERRMRLQEDVEEKLLHQFIPPWWKQCQVVGFDLSGDETAHPSKYEAMMDPLFKLSASITIHAGEAATAESIWDAVYLFGARRIGHGLRLRENTRLLNYCVKEGVCIEMCPTSNQFTNGFININSPDEYDGSWRQCYPLRYNLVQGLDVCINTDNRQLHSGHTLTDEYMRAARMAGSLTKWEILKLLKAGFKHAFLLKSDIEILLAAMEDEVYNFIMDNKSET